LKLKELLDIAMKGKLVEFQTRTTQTTIHNVKGIIGGFEITHKAGESVECEILVMKRNNSTCHGRIGRIIPESVKFFDETDRTLFKIEHDM